MSDAAGQGKGIFTPTERYKDEEETSQSNADARQAQIWTAMPVILNKHDLEKNTVHATPAIKLNQVKDDGQTQWIEIKKMEDLPILYYGGGGVCITNPLKDGDEGLAVCASRSIDKWWKEGKTQEQLHSRMHDLSDSFIVPGFRSQPRKLKDVSEKTWQLRTDDKKSYVELDPGDKRNFTIHIEDLITIESVNGDISIKAKGKVNIKADEIILDGTVRLGGPNANREVGARNSRDSRGDTLVSNLATKVFVP